MSIPQGEGKGEKQMKILVADHDAQTLHSLQADLSELFPQEEVECFDKPIKLFKYWSNHSNVVKLVITPAVSNIADGFRIIESAAASRLFAPIFLTAKQGGEELEHLSSIRGASGFLCKPITKESLLTQLEKWRRDCMETGEETNKNKSHP